MLILSWWLFAVVLSVLAGHEFAVLEFYFWMKNINYYPLWCFICAINLYLVSELLLISLQISVWFWRTIVHVYIFALRWWIDILACLLSGVSFAYLTWLCKVCYFMLFSMEINISLNELNFTQLCKTCPWTLLYTNWFATAFCHESLTRNQASGIHLSKLITLKMFLELVYSKIPLPYVLYTLYNEYCSQIQVGFQ